MTTTSPLHSYMQGLLRHVEGAHDNSEVVIDNAIIPTRSLRMKQRRRRARPTRCYSSSAFPESSSKRSILKSKNNTRRGVNTVSFLQTIDNESFQSPQQRPASKKLSSLEFFSPQSVLSPLSPRSARWSPTTRPTLVRQESDTALHCAFPKGSNSTRRGVNTVLQTIDNEGFQSPQRPSKKLSWLELSPQSVLSALSPRSARWSPITRPTLVRQESDTALHYPKRIIDSPQTSRDFLNCDEDQTSRPAWVGDGSFLDILQD
jgi:hypothetical protein